MVTTTVASAPAKEKIGKDLAHTLNVVLTASTLTCDCLQSHWPIMRLLSCWRLGHAKCVQDLLYDFRIKSLKTLELLDALGD